MRRQENYRGYIKLLINITREGLNYSDIFLEGLTKSSPLMNTKIGNYSHTKTLLSVFCLLCIRMYVLLVIKPKRQHEKPCLNQNGRANENVLCMCIVLSLPQVHLHTHTHTPAFSIFLMQKEQDSKKSFQISEKRAWVEMKADCFTGFHSIKSTKLNDLRIQSRFGDMPSSSTSFYIFSSLFKH